VTLAALSLVYCDQGDVEAVLSYDGVHASLDDDAAGLQLSAEEQERLTTKAVGWATGRVNFYLLGRYPAADLAQSWTVNWWAAVLAAYFLRGRRGNPPPGSVKEWYEESVEDMKAVQAGVLNLPDTGLRNSGWPAWSNVRVDHRYLVRKLRVEEGISGAGRPAAPFRRNRDFWGHVPEPY
jgi:hypothetical protein